MRGAVYLVAMFVDRIKVVAKAGDGGRGCVSFRREKFVPRGGPDGGDGGRGGDIILRADEHTDNLAGLFYEPLIKAKNGAHGMGKQMHGRGAVAKIVKVPIGTVVHRMDSLGDPSTFADSTMAIETGTVAAPKMALEQIADLALPNEEFVLCHGGKGGKGNVHFKSARNRAPRQYPRERKARKGLLSSSCGRSRMPAWSVIRTPGSRRSCGGFPRRIRRWRRILSRRCIR